MGVNRNVVPSDTHTHRSHRSGSAVAGILLCLALAAGPVWSHAASSPAQVRVTLVTASVPGDDPTVVVDAARGLRDAQRAFAGRAVVSRISLRTTGAEIAATKGAPPQLRAALLRAALSSNLVIAWGDPLTDVALDAARAYPRIHFVLVSAVYVTQLPPNVTQGSFEDTAEAFLAGAAAAMQSRSQAIGFIGPLDRGPQKIGYRAGAYYANARTRVITDFLGVSRALLGNDRDLPPSWIGARFAGASEPTFHDARKAEEVALAQYDRGVDVIYVMAGASAAGVYRAAVSRRGWVMDQGGVSPAAHYPPAWRDRRLMTTTERPDLAVYHLVAQSVEGIALPHRLVWGLTYPQPPQPMIGFALDAGPGARSGAVGSFLGKILEQIRAEKLVVPYGTEQLAEFFKQYPP